MRTKLKRFLRRRALPSHRSRVRVAGEYVSFHDVSGRDWYSAVEADFLYRTLYYALYGVRVGYGVYVGEGGTVEELDTMGRVSTNERT